MEQQQNAHVNFLVSTCCSQFRASTSLCFSESPKHSFRWNTAVASEPKRGQSILRKLAGDTSDRNLSKSYRIYDRMHTKYFLSGDKVIVWSKNL